MGWIDKVGYALMKRLPPETAHNIAIKGLKLGFGPKAEADRYDNLKTTLCGLNLPNPVGLAAGFDKNADVPDAMLAAGFGFVECGTVTPRPQAGNPRPRLFRLPEDKAVINRMGFNNGGLDAFKDRMLMRRGAGGIVGANLGANKDSHDRIADYVTGLEALWGLADYFTINISSPNTPGLRDLQAVGAMDELLSRIEETRARLSAEQASAPIFLKIAPDIDDDSVERIISQAREYGISALIISNTTIARPDSLQSANKVEAGGLSGAPLMERSTRLLREFYAVTEGRLPLIGVGGISSGADAYAKIRAGACAVQLYSALVYEGPQLVSQICEGLSERLAADGFKSVAEAVGTARRPATV